jgi:hypothetical protein
VKIEPGFSCLAVPLLTCVKERLNGNRAVLAAILLYKFSGLEGLEEGLGGEVW